MQQIATRSFPCLPDELKLLIFSYLEPQDKLRSSRVCLEWSRLVLDHSLWRNVVLDGQKMTDEEAAEVVRMAPQPNKLCLQYFFTEHPLVLEAVAHCWSGLEVLEVLGIKTLDVIALKRVARRCTNLREVTVNLNLWCAHSKTIRNPVEIFSGCQQLRSFSLKAYNLLTPLLFTPRFPSLTQALVYRPQNCDEELKALMAGSNGQLRQLYVLGQVWEESTMEVLSKQRLEFLYTCFVNPMYDTFLRVGVHKQKNLRELHLLLHTLEKNIPSHTALTSLFQKQRFPHLEVLTVQGSSALDDHHLFLVSQNCPSLVKLILIQTCASFRGLMDVAKGCRSLKHVKFHSRSESLNLTESELKNLAATKDDLEVVYVGTHQRYYTKQHIPARV